MDYYSPPVEVTDPLTQLPPRSAYVTGNEPVRAGGLTRFLQSTNDGQFLVSGSRKGANGNVVSWSAVGPTAEPSRIQQDLTGDATPFIGDPVQIGSASSAAANLQEAIENTSSRRIKLLAVQYASSKSSPEVLARMEILDARMNRYSPRVTDGKLSELDRASVRLTDMADDLDEIDRLLAGG
ncbi:hypothetical protein [Pseudomonas sp.]|uniref:hypothetical protein n=1 Tax=Pseudomonas sp. TaxID=306 RepID=UPI0028AC8AC2|nr:hypothetical protein [Pseudomonas sp.]